MIGKVKPNRGIGNDGASKARPLALYWLSRMGLAETYLFIRWNDYND